jgi:predicted ATPase
LFEENINQYIRSVKIDIPESRKNEYPFTLEAIKGVSELKLNPKVSYIVGENGTGKSTLIEAIAVAYGFNPEGGSKNFNFETNSTHSVLSEYITLAKGIKKPKDGFFLRAESFYNVASNIDELDKGGGGPKLIDSYGSVSLHKQSHGESFIIYCSRKLPLNL